MRVLSLIGLLCGLLSVQLLAQAPDLGNDTTLCDQGPYLLDAGPGYVSYLWSNGDQTQTTYINTGGSYWVRVEDTASQIYYDTISILIFEVPFANFLGSNVCLGTQTEFTNYSTFGASPIVNYYWDFGDGATDTAFEPTHVFPSEGVQHIQLAAVNDKGCADTLNGVVDVYGLPFVDAGPDTFMNEGDTVHLTGIAIEDSIKWQPFAYLSSDTVLNPLAFPVLTVNYVLAATDSNYCTARDTAQVYVNNAPVAVNDLATLGYAQGSVIDVQRNDSDPNNDVLTTSIVSGPFHGQATVVNGDSINYTPNSTYNGRDTIIYRICDTGQPPLCATARLEIIISNTAPQAVNDVAATTTTSSVTINLIDNDSDPNVGQNLFISEVGDPVHGSISSFGFTEIEYTPDMDYTGIDSFYYVLCDNGLPIKCDTGWVYITITKEGLSIPNSFSPNGDGVLDRFVVSGIAGFPGNKLTIFTRWGDVLLEMTDYDNSWAGTTGFNEDLPEGVYYYVLDLNNGSAPKSGYIVLER